MEIQKPPKVHPREALTNAWYFPMEGWPLKAIKNPGHGDHSKDSMKALVLS